MDLNTLRQSLPLLPVFISAARHLNFTKAAEELFLTQGAVSQNIKKLEENLGCFLFHRFTRRIELTEEGENLLNTVHKSLFDIENEISELKSRELKGSLNVSCTPSFATNWLAPRLKDFSEKCPGILIHLRCRNDIIDFEQENIDLAIYYGTGEHPDLHATFLMEEHLFPVCSETYANQNSLWNNPDALKECLILHDNHPWPNAQYYSEWKHWSEKVGIVGLPYRSGFSFDQCVTATTAAIHGMGIALGRKQLIKRYIENGKLVAPLQESLKSEQTYLAVTLKEKANSPRIKAFVDWLVAEGIKYASEEYNCGNE